MKPHDPRIWLIRLCFSLAFVCSITVLVLHWGKIKVRVEATEAELKQQTQGRKEAESQLAIANEKLREATARVEEVNRAMVVAVNDALVQKRKAEEVFASLRELNKRQDETKAELDRYRNTGMQPEQIEHVAAELKHLELALRAAEKDKAVLEKRVQLTEEKSDQVLLPADLKTKVLAYDPKWHFVVLDLGSSGGMRANAELLVAREGRLVGKIKIARVGQVQSVGNLVSGCQFSEVLEGDLAIPAFVSHDVCLK